MWIIFKLFWDLDHKNSNQTQSLLVQKVSDEKVNIEHSSIWHYWLVEFSYPHVALSQLNDVKNCYVIEQVINVYAR